MARCPTDSTMVFGDDKNSHNSNELWWLLRYLTRAMTTLPGWGTAPCALCPTTSTVDLWNTTEPAHHTYQEKTFENSNKQTLPGRRSQVRAARCGGGRWLTRARNDLPRRLRVRPRGLTNYPGAPLAWRRRHRRRRRGPSRWPPLADVGVWGRSWGGFPFRCPFDFVG